MMNGMNHSLAALRGWIILGEDKFKAERAKSWSEEIEPAFETLKGFAVNWTDPKNIERLKVIESKLTDFKTFQQEIEDIAQTTENLPASKILLAEAAPRAKILAEQFLLACSQVDVPGRVHGTDAGDYQSLGSNTQS